MKTKRVAKKIQCVMCEGTGLIPEVMMPPRDSSDPLGIAIDALQSIVRLADEKWARNRAVVAIKEIAAVKSPSRQPDMPGKQPEPEAEDAEDQWPGKQPTENAADRGIGAGGLTNVDVEGD